MKRMVWVVMGIAGVLATAVHGAVVLRNAPWATRNVVTNGMGGAHNFLPDNTTNFTVEAWVKPSLAGAGSSYNYAAHYIFSVIGSSGAAENMVLVLNSNNVDGHFRMYYNNVWSPDTVSVPGDKWTHVAVSKTKDSARFFTNGVFACEWEDSTHLASALHTKYLPAIGCQRTGVRNTTAENDRNNHVFQGALADVRLWTTARTDAEIAANYATRLTGAEEGLYLYVPFNDGTIGESVVKNLADGYDLTVPPTQELAWDPELDEKFGATATPPWSPAPATALTALRHSRAKIWTDVKLTNTTYTLEAWARIDVSIENRQYLLGQYVQDDRATWVSLVVTSHKPQFFIGSSSPITSDTSVTSNEWFHVAGTRDENGVVRLYLNGAEVGRGVRDASCGPPPDSFIELFNTGSNASIDGCLREGRVWERARSAAEIAASYRTTVTNTEEGLIGRWPLDEGSGSHVRNAVTGAWNTLGKYQDGGTLEAVNTGFTWAQAEVLTSSFAGNNTNSRIQTDVKITTSDFTVETWARVETIPPDLCYLMGQWVSGNTTTWFSLIFNNEYPRFRNGSGTSGTTITSGTAITAGRWFHLAATRSGTTMKLYLNGEAVATGTALTTDPPPNAYFQLFTTGGNKTWGGELREARVWNYARTQAQIADAMNDSAQGTETGLLGCWPMDEGAGATAVVNKKTGATHAISVNNSWLTGQSTAPTFAEPQPDPPVVEDSVEFGGSWFGVARTEKAIDVQDFTFETWVRPTAMHGSQTFLFSQWARGENGQGDANNPNRFLMGLNNTDHFGFFIAGTDEMGNRGGWQQTTETVPLNEWTHLAATRQGSTLRFYINGQLKKTVPNYTTLSPWNPDKPHCLTLGSTDTAYNTEEGRMLQGSMREVRVWNKALSGLRISRIYNHKVNVAEEPNLIGYWPLEKPNAADSSLLVNEAEGGGETGYILAGWSKVSALNLADPTPPVGTVLIFR